MEHLPQTLKMNGLDGLHSQVLSHSQHLCHFSNIISTITLLVDPQSIIGIVHLLGINTVKVVQVLLNLQAIIHVPDTKEEGKVMLCHKSLHNFLTTKSCSSRFFIPPSFHLHLPYYWFSCAFERDHGSACSYGSIVFDMHWKTLFKSSSPVVFQEIEQLKACQSLDVVRLPCSIFFCHIFFLMFLQGRPSATEHGFLLIESTKQLVLPVVCPDARIRLWLEKSINYDSCVIMASFQFTEEMYNTVRHDLQHASRAIHSRVCFPHTILP